MLHEQADLFDSPRFLITDALHWEVRRIVITWSYHWFHEVFHEFTKHTCGPEASSATQLGDGQTPSMLQLFNALVPPECIDGWGQVRPL
ncbi:MAG: hypothetical protein AAF609_10755 [Cyanobacteria bacterium P01_C01_bin.120]